MQRTLFIILVVKFLERSCSTLHRAKASKGFQNQNDYIYILDPTNISYNFPRKYVETILNIQMIQSKNEPCSNSANFIQRNLTKFSANPYGPNSMVLKSVKLKIHRLDLMEKLFQRFAQAEVYFFPIIQKQVLIDLARYFHQSGLHSIQ